MPHLQSALGIGAIIAGAWALSEDRRAFPWRMVVGTLLLQAAIALLLLKVPVAREALFGLNAVVTAITTATNAGTSFVFGYLGSGPAPFAVTNPANLVNLAFTILPLVIVIAALAAMLWYWRITPFIVHAMALALQRTIGLGGAVGLSAAATTRPVAMDTSARMRVASGEGGTIHVPGAYVRPPLSNARPAR